MDQVDVSSEWSGLAQSGRRRSATLEGEILLRLGDARQNSPDRNRDRDLRNCSNSRSAVIPRSADASTPGAACDFPCLARRFATLIYYGLDETSDAVHPTRVTTLPDCEVVPLGERY